MDVWLHKTLEYWSAGGPLLVPMVIICFGIWGFIFRSSERLRSTIREGRKLNEDLNACSSIEQMKGLLQSQSRLGGGLGAMISQALLYTESRENPMEILQSSMNEVMRQLRKDFMILSAFTAVAPLLGLLGTVAGMIQTFDAVSMVSGETGARVAEGISQALITTQFGLVIALPGVFGLAQLQRMISYIEVLMAECRVQIVTWVEQSARKKMV